MSLASILTRAMDAIAAANRVLKANGLTPAKVPGNELAFCNRLPRAEVVVTLKEPARQLVTLIHNRSVQLAADEAELAADEAELEALAEEHTTYVSNPLWGAFS